MGTYSELYINEYPVYSTKNYVDPIVMTIFREMDKKIYPRKLSARNKFTWGNSFESNNEIETVYEYSNSIKNIQQRLDIIGFSLVKIKKDFNKALSSEIEELVSIIGTRPVSTTMEDYYTQQKETLKTLEKANFDNWLNSLSEIIDNKIKPSIIENHSQFRNPLTQYIFNESKDGWMLHYPCYDIRSYLRALIEVFPSTSLVTQDITGLVDSGYYEPEDEVCKMSIINLTEGYPTNEKIIILTEGSTDKEILEKSLSILYPHLVDYFSFMDFSLSNNAGGANSLITTIKSFIGSEIKNRIVAIFDNDTATSVARKSLHRIKIPNNLKIVCLPKLEFAKSYPTIGPNGNGTEDINGLACSIELYFGSDILKNKDGYSPIRWKGFDESLNQYQGEIINKKILQLHFIEKCSRCRRDPSLIGSMDWSPMEQVFQEIFTALE